MHDDDMIMNIAMSNYSVVYYSLANRLMMSIIFIIITGRMVT